MRSVAMFPGGGNAENVPLTGTRGSRWRGLRLVRQDDAHESQMSDSRSRPKQSNRVLTPEEEEELKLRVSGD